MPAELTSSISSVWFAAGSRKLSTFGVFGLIFALNGFGLAFEVGFSVSSSVMPPRPSTRRAASSSEASSVSSALFLRPSAPSSSPPCSSEVWLVKNRGFLTSSSSPAAFGWLLLD